MIAAYNGNRKSSAPCSTKARTKRAKDKDGLTAEKWAFKGRRDETAKMLK